MDYEKLTNDFIEKAMKTFDLAEVYQEFLDSLVHFDDFKKPDFKDFQKYIDRYGE